MSKQLYGSEARNALKKGLDEVANAVKVTIGPFGRNVGLENSYGTPTITNDGVSIAKEIKPEDDFERMGADIAIEVASKTNDLAGDGTTTSIVLAQAIAEVGFKEIDNRNAMEVKREIEAAGKLIIEELKSMAKPITSDEDIKNIATISSESEEMGQVIADILSKTGKDGVVITEESPIIGMTSEVVEGFKIDKGYVTPYLVTSREKMEAEYKNVPVLITDQKINSMAEVASLFKSLVDQGQTQVVVIADDFGDNFIAEVVALKMQGMFNALAIKAPFFGERRNDALEDIAFITGTTFKQGIVPDEFGLIKKIKSTKDSSIIVGNIEKDIVDKRVEELKSQKDSLTGYSLEALNTRIARLAGGIGIIKVGASTETEMKYLKLKIEDAVNATKAAIEEGVIKGGGFALLIISSLKKFKNNILVEAIRAPYNEINKNAGMEFKTPDTVIDPVKVTRLALQNAISAVATMITTEVLVIKNTKKDE